MCKNVPLRRGMIIVYSSSGPDPKVVLAKVR
jgi:hypothetical protein